MEQVLRMAIDKQAVADVADEFKIVYTPFHAAAISSSPKCCTAWE